MLLCLAGCKDSENNSAKDQAFRADQKKLMDTAKTYGITNLETLGMTLDSTTKDQAIDILKSRGYEFITRLGSDFMKNLMNDKELKILIFNPLLKEVKDKLNKSTVLLVKNSKSFQKEKDKSKEFMLFVFDKNQKLIMFFKQYSENKEKSLVVYEGMNNSYVSKNEKKSLILIHRKNLSKAFIVTKDPNATLYIILNPLIASNVYAFMKTEKIWEKLKETQELLKMEKENFKEIEEEYRNGLINLEQFRKKLREKRKELNQSKEYKELKAKVNEKLWKEFLKHLNKPLN
jgi:hypothetical protein